MSNWEDYNKGFLTDGIRFLIGKKLGEGVSREVYEYGGNPVEYVVKIETEGDRFQNVVEYQFWQSVRDAPDMLRWIAPCARISPQGNYMIQERTTPITLGELRKRLPKVPVWCSDLKVSNWGRLPNGKIVCHDYGTHVAIGHASTRLRKADWWD